MLVDAEFDHRCNTPSDMVGHMETLKALASKVDHVTEFGQNQANSTWAFLAARPRVLRSYDLKAIADQQSLKDAADEASVDYRLIQANVLEVEIDPTDLLMVDSWHHYWQLRAELSLHASKVRQFLVFHDTESNGSAWKDSTTGAELQGILPAIVGLVEQGEWKCIDRYTRSCGLMVLQRKRPPEPRTIDNDAVRKAKALARAAFDGQGQWRGLSEQAVRDALSEDGGRNAER